MEPNSLSPPSTSSHTPLAGPPEQLSFITPNCLTSSIEESAPTCETATEVTPLFVSNTLSSSSSECPSASLNYNSLGSPKNHFPETRHSFGADSSNLSPSNLPLTRDIRTMTSSNQEGNAVLRYYQLQQMPHLRLPPPGPRKKTTNIPQLPGLLSTSRNKSASLASRLSYDFSSHDRNTILQQGIRVHQLSPSKPLQISA
ncbi:unnamed protein product [Protopolystoma xenopodis]|uniref:Uncharacterized protein n=1 Tax=Protopolystoma xenopodis TaxID=117903 RepID=A0A448WL15_9PLAT|nr:unnamed protein product [Protopolystoma xenopodis]